MAELVVRDAGDVDLPFLREMLYEASFAMDEPKPPRETIEQPQIIRYLPDLSKDDECALVAEIDGRRVGAAWYQLFTDDDPGYGFVDASTPELSIAVLPEERGRGIGNALLKSLLNAARSHGFDALSLSVARSNLRAKRLYERIGFDVVAVDEVEDGLTMRAATRGSYRHWTGDARLRQCSGMSPERDLSRLARRVLMLKRILLAKGRGRVAHTAGNTKNSLADLSGFGLVVETFEAALSTLIPIRAARQLLVVSLPGAPQASDEAHVSIMRFRHARCDSRAPACGNVP